MTVPVPAVSGGVSDCVTVPEKPRAENAVELLLATERLPAVPVCSVIAPPVMVDAAVVPVIASIFPSKVPTVSLISTLIGVTPAAVVPAVEPVFTKWITVPLTVMVSPPANGDARPLTAPDSTVEVVIGPAGPTWFAAVPGIVLSPAGVAGVLVGIGLTLKS